MPYVVVVVVVVVVPIFAYHEKHGMGATSAPKGLEDGAIDEKEILDSTETEPISEKPGPRVTLVANLIAGLLIWILFHDGRLFGYCVPLFADICHDFTAADSELVRCPSQPPALNLGPDWDPLIDQPYADLAARRLSQAVQIRTESCDDMPMDPTDERWDKIHAFSHMLEVEFPKVYNALEHRAINTHGHLFEWKGKDETLQPILLMAHIDTVPVLQDTVDLWRYPPFEGTVTVNGTADSPGTWIWGRGSSDCKNSLMGIMGAVERLVTEGYTPDRTVVLSFGFDEEVSPALLLLISG